MRLPILLHRPWRIQPGCSCRAGRLTEASVIPLDIPPAATRPYSHVLPGMDERAASVVARLILDDEPPGEAAR
jgi:hypothetical protein